MLKKIAGCIGFILSLLYYIISTYSFFILKSDCSKNFQYVKFYKILFNYTASFFSYFYSDVTNYGEEIKVLAVVGNKCDLYEREAVPEEDGRAFAVEHGALFMNCSAKDGTNIDALFDACVKKYFNP